MSDNNDHIYFNINKSVSQDSVFNFDENRISPILKNPSDYELTVSRFSIPTLSIPIRFQVPELFKISLEFNGTRIDKFVDYVSNSADAPYYKPYYAIWYYSEISEAVSNTLKDLHDQMVIAQPTFPPTKECLMTYDSATDLFSVLAQTAYATPNIKIIFNQELTELFSFQMFSNPTMLDPDILEYLLLIKDNFNNSSSYGGGGYIMTQEYSTTGLWNISRNILFETNSIPVETELLGQSSLNVQRQVITDFNIDRSTRSDRSSIQFFPQGTLRWVDLNSSEELRRIDIKVSWEDISGNIYPLFITGEDPLGIKIQFRKKNIAIFEEIQYNE
tara:strand:- start:1935 stop:2927 length:993 start_codon:yes stop_codon:yes gene_type:complete